MLEGSASDHDPVPKIHLFLGQQLSIGLVPFSGLEIPSSRSLLEERVGATVMQTSSWPPGPLHRDTSRVAARRLPGIRR